MDNDQDERWRHHKKGGVEWSTLNDEQFLDYCGVRFMKPCDEVKQIKRIKYVITNNAEKAKKKLLEKGPDHVQKKYSRIDPELGLQRVKNNKSWLKSKALPACTPSGDRTTFTYNSVTYTKGEVDHDEMLINCICIVQDINKRHSKRAKSNDDSVEREGEETGEQGNGIDDEEEGGVHDPFRNDGTGVPLAGIHLMDGEVLVELGELGLCRTAEGEREEWGGEGTTPPPPPPRGKSMKDD